jgi:hypothetical protein
VMNANCIGVPYNIITINKANYANRIYYSITWLTKPDKVGNFYPVLNDIILKAIFQLPSVFGSQSFFNQKS